MSLSNIKVGLVAFSGASGPTMNADFDYFHLTAPAITTTVNDNVVGTGDNQFEYAGSGWLYGSDPRCNAGDNHWSGTAGDYVQIRFNGTNIKYHGAMDTCHGILAWSIDGGAETTVDCYSSTRQDDVVLVDSGTLSSGQHTLKVRVTGMKNASSSNYYVTTDRVDITS
jgi:hypothetical protein